MKINSKRMSSQKLITMILFSLFVNVSVYAQTEQEGDPELQDTEVVIQKDRKIELNKEEKLYEFIKWKPENIKYRREDGGKYKVFNYQLSKETEAYIPATVVIDNDETSYLQYLKAGIGNYNSPLLDVNLVTPYDADQMLSFKYKHLSFGRGEVDGKNSASSTNQLALNGTKIWDRVKTTVAIGYRSDVNHYYGYDDSDIINRADIKKNNRFFNAGISIEDNDLNDDLSYEIGADFKRFDDNYNNFENTLELNGDFKYLDKYYINAQTSVSNLSTVTNSRSYFDVTPYYRFDVVNINIDAGLSVIGQNDDIGDLTQFKVFPYLSATYNLTDEYQAFFTLDGGYEFNTLYKYSSLVPYLNNTNPIQNTENNILVNAGIRGNINEEWSTELKFGIKSVRHLPIYVNSSTNQALFNIVYDTNNTTVSSIGLISEYYLSESHDFLFSLDYNHYSGGAFSPYHLPALTLNLKGHHEVFTDLSIQWQYTLLTGITAFDTESDTDVELSEIHKLDLSIHYQIQERLGAFISADNLLGQSYARYYLYPERKLQVKAGVTYRF